MPFWQPRKVRAELTLIGREFRKEDIERLKKHLDLLEESFADDEWWHEWPR